MTQLVSLILIRWKVTYPVNSAIQRFSNRALAYIVETNLSMVHDFDTKPRGIGVPLLKR